MKENKIETKNAAKIKPKASSRDILRGINVNISLFLFIAVVRCVGDDCRILHLVQGVRRKR